MVREIEKKDGPWGKVGGGLSLSLDYSTDSTFASWIFNEWPPVIAGRGVGGGFTANRRIND